MMKQIALLVLLCCGSASTMAASDWECFKGSPERTSSSDVSAPDTPYLLWKVDFGSELHSSPLVRNGQVFQVAYEELVCIDCETGTILWKSSIPASYETPALTDETVVVPTIQGVTALSIEDGEFQWEYSASERSSADAIDYIVSPPGVSQGKIVVETVPTVIIVPSAGSSNNNANLVCLDEINGKKRWSAKTSMGAFSSPCIVYGKVFAASREMICVDLEKGKVLWNSERKYPWNAEDLIKERYAFDHSTPALYHGILIAGSSDMRLAGENLSYAGWQKIVALDQYTGDIFWEWSEEGILRSSPALNKGRIYFYSYDGMVRCLSLQGGIELWETSISEPRELYLGGNLGIWPSPAVADGKVYVGSLEGIFYCLDANTGEVLWEYETEGPIHSVPAIVPGQVLISSGDGHLYCFGIDPDTYLSKAQDYLKDGEIEKAQQFLVKAREYTESEEEITRIENLLEIVDRKMPEYRERIEKIKEAESLMNEADRIMWDKKFEKAHDLYNKACTIFQEVDDDFREVFCMERIEYITQRMPEETTEIPYYLGILILCGVIAFLLIARVKKQNSE